MRLAETWFTVLDTETTGLDPKKDTLIEVAAWHLDHSMRRWGRFCSFVDPERVIPPFISGLTGITDLNVQGAPKRADVIAALREFIPPKHIIVAHNAPFDSGFIPEINPGNWLCTKRLAQHLLPGIDSYSLQTLRYHFNPYGRVPNQGDLDPHRAEADVAVLAFVLARLTSLYEDERIDRGQVHEDGDCWHSEDLLDFANAPLRIETMPFGKHKGALLESVPLDYVRWLLGTPDVDADLRWNLEVRLNPRSPERMAQRSPG